MAEPPQQSAETLAGIVLLANRRGLLACLDAVPHFAFSETGRANLCRRFRLTDAELSATLTAYGEGGTP
ncbi:hypothetical protein [Hymenobacter guriensis]|uniref:DUF4248 domain-containing protein n=1 Tax=Hymenobacter guriensis TaxID=2793065 RepID=A0ABS0KXP4_9BACT|nr:hypothetical protein [Hymenobacter guriensis]MBG8552576.1 hypothetical protein [Hymenobacter guriensis]